MNYRFAALLLPVLVFASTVLPSTAQTPAPRFPSRTELIREIDVNEKALKAAESAHAAKLDLVRIYDNLGGLYVDAVLYLKAEDVMQRSVMGDSAKAEKELLRAIRIRETIPDPIALNLTRGDLADVYLKQHKYAKAIGPAQQAVETLAATPATDPAKLIAAQQRLALALCGMHQCDQAVQIFRDATAMATHSYGPDSLTAGIATYQLGYFYWKDGNFDAAADAMRRGTTRMRMDMGWGHAVYLNAMAQYAKFLRERGHLEEASKAESEVRKATSTVDVRTFTARAE
jgi:tetratricopeptide (TPR) repeat protein